MNMEEKNNIKKTIWKNKIFSNDISSNSKKIHENMDILKIEQKLKKINKRKKYKENFKNIETFDNIYEQKEEENEETNISTNSEPLKCASSFNDEEDLSNETEMVDDDDDYENIEGFKEGASNKKRRKKRKKGKKGKKEVNEKTMFDGVISIIETLFNIYKYGIFLFFYLYNQFDSFLTKLSDGIVDFSSEKNTTEEKKSDGNILKSIFYYTLSLPICIFVTYNWFFLISYADDTPGCEKNNYGLGADGKPLCRPNNDEKRFKISFDDVGYYKNVLDFFFGYAILPLFYVDKLVFGDAKLPYYFSLIKSKNIQQTILLFFSFPILFLFGKFSLGIFASTTILTSYILDLINEFIPFKDTDEVSKNTNLMLKEVFGNKFGTFLAIGYFIIYWVIKLIIAVFSISFSTILISLFMFTHSIFGIFLYGKDSISEKFIKIDDFIKTDLKNFMSDADDCRKDFWKTLGRFMVDVFYKNKYSIFYICILIYNAFLTTKINSTNLKWIIGFLICIPGFVSFEYIINNIIKTYDIIYNKKDY